MIYLLMIFNLLAIFFGYVYYLLCDRPHRYRFLACAALPLIAAITLFILTQPKPWAVIDGVVFLFRGWFILSVVSGIFANYIAEKLKKSVE